jgi:hypothetical protein
MLYFPHPAQMLVQTAPEANWQFFTQTSPMRLA